MKLNYQGLKDAAAWAKAGIELPPYDVEALARDTVADPRWAHFGIGKTWCTRSTHPTTTSPWP